MRKIGMTRRQERKLLLLEGSYYVLLIAGLVVSVGSIVLKGIEVYMRKQLSYFTFHYPNRSDCRKYCNYGNSVRYNL